MKVIFKALTNIWTYIVLMFMVIILILIKFFIEFDHPNYDTITISLYVVTLVILFLINKK